MRRTLPEAVAQTCDEVIAVLGEPAAERVRCVRDAVPRTPTVVLVGETQRGKSTLTNALLATPDLSPVRPGCSTSTQLVFAAGRQWSAVAHYPECSEPIDPKALADTALVTERRSPRSIEVSAPIPLLERFTLVDTPGVGGLGHSGRDIVGFVLDGVPTALLMVLDASGPISRSELDFLNRLSDRVETVLFALTKIDLYRGWREVLEADREALAGTRFGVAQWFPVSAGLFEQAAASPEPGALRRRSGIAELQIALQQQVTGRAVMLGAANTLRAAQTALDGELWRARLDHRTATAGDRQAADRIRALEHRRTELDAIRTAPGREWQLRLRAELARARVDCGHDVAARARVAHSRLRQDLDAALPDRFDTVPHQVDIALQALAGRVGVALTDRISRVLDTAFTELFSEAERTELRAELTRDGPVVTLQPPQRRPANAEDAVLVVVGFSGGMGIGRIAALPLAGLGSAATALVLPVSLVLGLGAGWWMARTRRAAANRAHLRQWLAEVFTEARAALERAVSDQMIDAEHQLALALDRALAARQATVDEELAAVRRTLDLAVAERERLARAAADRIATLEACRGQVIVLSERITDLRDNT